MQVILNNAMPVSYTHLNDFYTPFLYAPGDNMGTLATSLYKFMGPYGGQWNVICAGVILIMIPTLIVFLSLQKYIYNGFTAGAVKYL